MLRGDETARLAAAASSAPLQVLTRTADLADTATLPSAVSAAFAALPPGAAAESAQLFNVSGTLGPMVPVHELADLGAVERHKICSRGMPSSDL